MIFNSLILMDWPSKTGLALNVGTEAETADNNIHYAISEQLVGFVPSQVPKHSYNLKIAITH
jgi:hypothetical protein